MTSRFLRWVRYFAAADRCVRRPRRTRLTLERLEDRTVPTTITWTGNGQLAPGGKLWSVVGNWDLNRLPQPGDDVNIPAVTGTTSVAYDLALTTSIDSLTSAVSFNLPQGEIQTTGGGSVAAGGVTMNNHAVFALSGGTVLSISGGNQTLGTSDGHGGFTFADGNTGNTISIDGGAHLTVASPVNITGGAGKIAGNGTLINQGGIIASSAGQTITLQNTGGVNNAGGSLNADLGGVIALDTPVTGGSALADGNNGSQISQNGVAITGTTIGGKLVFTNTVSNVLSGVTIAASGDVVGNNAIEQLAGLTTLNGKIEIDGGSFLGVGVTANEHDEIAGSGSIVFDASTANQLSLNNAVQLTLDAGVTVTGQNGTIGVPFAGTVGTLVNKGTIQESAATPGTITLNADASNSGTIQALGGGTLAIIGGRTVSGAGTITTDSNAGSQVTQNAATIQGDTIAGKLVYLNNGTNNFLSGVTISGTGDVLGNGYENVTVGLTLNGTININGAAAFGFGVTTSEPIEVAGTGSIVFDGNAGNVLGLNNAVQLTLDSGITITGQNGTIGTPFAGTIGTLVNKGTIQESAATAGTITLDANTTNNGTIQALLGGTLVLANCTVSGTGTITTDGNAASQITQSAATVSGNTIAGKLFFTNSGDNNYLSGVTISGTGDVLGNGYENVTVGLTLNGTININGAAAFGFGVTASETIEVAGTGSIVFDGNASNVLGLNNAVQLTLDSGITITGQNGTIGAPFAGTIGTLVNKGTIQESAATPGTITLNADTTNSGTIQALGGGTLAIIGHTVSGAGTITTDSSPSSQVTQNAATIQGNTIAGKFVYINNGDNNYLSGVTISGTGDVLGNGYENVTVGLTLNGTINVNGAAAFGFGVTTSETIEVAGTGSIVFDGNASNVLGLNNAVQLTLDSGITITGQNGTIGAPFAGTIGTLVNKGTIQESAATAGTITLDANTTNNGTIQALLGGTLVLANCTVSGTGTITTDGNAASQITQSAATVSGNTIAGKLFFTNSGGNVLSGVTVSGTGDVLGNNTLEQVTGSLTLNGKVNINGGSWVGFGVTASEQITITGTGSIVFDTNASNRLSLDNQVQLTVGLGITIDGANGFVGLPFAGTVGTVINKGTIAADTGNGTFTVDPATFTNDINTGTIATATGCLVNLTGPFTNFSGTTLTGGVYNIAGTFRFTGANIVTNSNAFITLSGPASAIQDQNQLDALANFASNSGIFTLKNGRVFTTAGDLSNNSGSVVLDASTGNTPSQLIVVGNYNQTGTFSNTVLTAGGILSVVPATNSVNIGSGTNLIGTGTVNGNISDSGKINPDPASAPGKITVNGNVSFNSGASYFETIAGTAPATGYSQLSITGTETFGSGVNLTGVRIQNFVPLPGTTFLIHPVTGTVTGNFAQGSSVVIGNIPFNVTYASGTGVNLTVATPTTVYVDDRWAGTASGADPANDPIGSLVFGYNAFSDIQSAVTQVAVGGTVVVFGGTYNAAVDFNKTLSEVQLALNTTTPGQTLVTLGGSVGLDAGNNFTTFDTTTAGLTISGKVSGANNLVKIGAGKLTLADAANDYTGGTTIAGGTLSFSADGELGAVPAAPAANNITLTNGFGTLQLAGGAPVVTLNANRGINLGSSATFDIQSETLIVAGNVTGGSGLTKIGAGDLELTPAAGSNTPGGIGIYAGRVLFDSQAALGNGFVALGSGTTLDYIGGSALTLANSVNFASGAGVATRASQLTLPASTILPSAGTMIFNDDDQPTSSIVVQANDTLTGNLTIQVGGNNATVGAVDWTGTLGGAGALIKTQPGTLILAAANGYAGTTINGGTVQAAADNNLGAAGGVTIDAGTFDAAGSFTSARAFTLGDLAATIQVDPAQTLTLSTTVVGAGSLTKTGGGMLDLSGLTNTYGGSGQATNVNAGTFRVSADAGLGNAANTLTFAGGTLQATGTFSTGRNLTLNSGGGTLDTNGSNLSLSASSTVGGAGGLTKAGTGTLTLASANSYTGATTINAGTLLLNGALASASTLTVNNGGTLAGSATIGGPVVVNSGGTVSPGSGTTPGEFTVNGNATENAGAILNIKIAGRTTPGTDYDQIVVNGTGTIAGTLNVSVVNGFQPAAADSFQILTFTTGTGDFSTRNGFALGNGLFLKEQFTPTNNPTALNLVVDQQPAITSASATTFTAAVAGSFTVTTIGLPAPALSETGSLPANVTFHDNGDGTATLAGTPPPGSSPSYPITITAHNGIGSDFTQNFTLNVTQGPIVGTPTVSPTSALQEAITTYSVAGTFTDPAAAAGAPYAAVVNWGDGSHDTATVSGIANPYSYAFNGSHTYATIGNFNVTVTATDKNGGVGTSPAQVVAVSATAGAFSYAAATKTLTITGNNFSFAQATTADAAGIHTIYTFTMDGVTQKYADANLSHVVVNGQGSLPTAILVTNDNYVDTHGATQETKESLSLGSKADAGVGTLQKFDQNGNPVSFLTLSGFPISYAYVGRNDGTVSLYGTAGVPYNGFVSAGNYSYIGGPGLFHLAQGATSVYGYSAGQASDFAYHYAANAGSAYVVSGIAFSYMSATDTVGTVTQAYFNVGVGFLVNTGVSKNPGKDFAYIIDSPGNDNFVGGTAYSYMYMQNSDGSYAELDTAYAFALVFAQSFVGGTDYATNSDSNKNILVGFHTH